MDSYFEHLLRKRSRVVMSALPEADDLEASLREYPDLFSGELGTLILNW